ncbi:MAG: transposase [Deltaproteobacteria bacterium]|nr:transposase [Deltaproteobacteria bacterium]
MTILRSSKLSFKEATEAKLAILQKIAEDYRRAVNWFIDWYWQHGLRRFPETEVVNACPVDWFTHRMKKVAAQQALGIVRVACKRGRKTKPEYKQLKIQAQCTIARLRQPKEAESFDYWLELRCIGNKLRLDLPLKANKHFNRFVAEGWKQHSGLLIDVKRRTVTVVFEKDEKPADDTSHPVAVDIGASSCLFACADFAHAGCLGLQIGDLLQKVARKQHGSKRQKKARRRLRHYIDEQVKNLLKAFQPSCVVAERLHNVLQRTKQDRKLNKAVRCLLGGWCYRYALERLRMTCEVNRVGFHVVPPQYTSQRCPACGHIEESNRRGRMFRCRQCGYIDHADLVAARNILWRFTEEITVPQAAEAG